LGGGVVLTLCHPFDYLRWLFGGVDSLVGETRRSGTLELDVEDTADVLMAFQSGVTASVHLDYIQRPKEHSLTVVGTEGTLRWDDATGETTWWSDDQATWQTVSPPDGFERNDLFLDEMRHFVDVVETNAGPACSLADGIEALKIALAARASAGSGQRVHLA
jgi:predicted dehydrogenase